MTYSMTYAVCIFYRFWGLHIALAILFHAMTFIFINCNNVQNFRSVCWIYSIIYIHSFPMLCTHWIRHRVGDTSFTCSSINAKYIWREKWNVEKVCNRLVFVISRVLSNDTLCLNLLFHLIDTLSTFSTRRNFLRGAEFFFVLWAIGQNWWKKTKKTWGSLL